VHVWAVTLDAFSTHGVALPLDARERADAARFATPLLTHRCLVRRWMRRSVLGRYLTIPPERIAYAAGRYGRPQLADGGSGLHFSATDSGDLALMAVAVDAVVGIDLELPRDIADRSDIVRRWFHPSERTQVFAKPTDAEQADVFFRLWTLKEAFVKALGLGLQLPFDSFAVEAGASGSTPRLAVPPASADVDPSTGWSLADFSRPPHAYAALALDRPIESVSIRAWRP
jgi:4'-phosphopantetheinyl transferase